MSLGQYKWSALGKVFPAWPGWECFSLSTGNVLALQKAAAAHISPPVGTCPVKLWTLTKRRGIAGTLGTLRQDSVFACSFMHLDETSACQLGTDIYGAVCAQLTRANINGAM